MRVRDFAASVVLSLLPFASAVRADLPPPPPSGPLPDDSPGYFLIHPYALTNDGDKCLSTELVEGGKAYGRWTYYWRLVQKDCPNPLNGTKWYIETRDGRPWNGRTPGDVTIRPKGEPQCVTNPDNFVPGSPTPPEDQILWLFQCWRVDQDRLYGIRQLHRIERAQQGSWTIRSLFRDELLGDPGPDAYPYDYWELLDNGYIHYRPRNPGSPGEFEFTPVD